MNIRINNFNIDAGVLTIHDGKGKKDRTLPLPETILPDIKYQFDAVKGIHRRDLEEGIAGAFMFDAIEKNIRTPGRNFTGSGFSLQRI